MWLLDTHSYRLAYFISDDVAPKYAILSHTWEQDEVTFQDMGDLSQARTKSGFRKIQHACDQAAEDGLSYVWVDTCCIDKSSSSELSEAINSMFSYYQRAARCYAYLTDVPGDHVDLCDDLDMDANSTESAPSRSGNSAGRPHAEDLTEYSSVSTSVAAATRMLTFRKRRWFTRGWTLQELIAPRRLLFYNRDWKVIGSLPRLILTVSEITGIDELVLLGSRDISLCCLAERFSWASPRFTTREEDMAYCLLGICGVNMPLMYGERGRSFTRLQEELLRTSEDRSLLAWSSSRSETVSYTHLTLPTKRIV